MMTTRSRKRAVAAFCTAGLLTLMLPATAVAQRSGRAGGGRDGGGGAAFELTRLNLLEADLGLNKDQKKAVKTILNDAHKEAAPVREGLTTSRGAIAAAILANKPQIEIDAAIGNYASQAAAMTALEMKALAQVLQAVTPEQRTDANGVRSAFFLMRGIFIDNKHWDEVPDGRSY